MIHNVHISRTSPLSKQKSSLQPPYDNMTKIYSVIGSIQSVINFLPLDLLYYNHNNIIQRCLTRVTVLRLLYSKPRAYVHRCQLFHILTTPQTDRKPLAACSATTQSSLILVEGRLKKALFYLSQIRSNRYKPLSTHR